MSHLPITPHPNQQTDTIAALLAAHAAGQLSTSTLIQTLATRRYATPSRLHRPVTEDPLDEWAHEDDAYNEPDTWDSVAHAWASHQLDDDTYLRIVQLADSYRRALPPEHKYSDTQPRDADGKFGSGGGGGGAPDLGSTDMTGQLTSAEHTEMFHVVAALTGTLSHDSPQDMKIAVAQRLVSSLKTNPAWRAYVDKNPPVPRESFEVGVTDPDVLAASRLVHCWAISSSDSITESVGLQVAAQREFGLDDAPTGHFDQNTLAAVNKLPPEQMAGMRAFVRAQYDATQADLAAAGLTHIAVWRGANYPKGTPAGIVPDGKPHTVAMDLQPISSFSGDEGTAAQFALGDGTVQVVYARIPAARILSTPRSGMGCKDENEVTVLGGTNLAMRSLAQRANTALPPGYMLPMALDVIAKKTPKRAAMHPPEHKYNPDQPRDEHGRFGSGGGGSDSDSGGGVDTVVAESLAQKVVHEGGFTYSPTLRSSPTTGVAFSPYPDREETHDAATITGADIRAYQEKNSDLLSQPGHHIGAWHNAADNKVYLDISVVTQDTSPANVQALMQQYHQLAAYDLGSGTEIASDNANHKSSPATNTSPPWRRGTFIG